MFHVGQKVVCIDDNWDSPFVDYPKLPVKGCIYHVRTSFNDRRCWLMLAEIVNEKRHGVVEEPAFLATFFRPVAERKTDISIFTAMLTPKREKIDA